MYIVHVHRRSTFTSVTGPCLRIIYSLVKLQSTFKLVVLATVSLMNLMTFSQVPLNRELFHLLYSELGFVHV